MKISLSLQDTNVLKGIALLLLLIHYCLYTGQGYGDVMLMGHPIFQNVGQFSKLCVVMFVFLSGYGLTAKTLKDGGTGSLWTFYRHRYICLRILPELRSAGEVSLYY